MATTAPTISTVSATPTPKPTVAPVVTADVKKPTAEAHLAAAAQHVQAVDAHNAAAQELKKENMPAAKQQAEIAAKHSEHADALTTETLVLYEFWID